MDASGPVLIRTRYDYSVLEHPDVSFDAKVDKGAISMTNQADLVSSDINRIMARFDKTGLLPDGMVMREPIYGDFSNLGDYHTMLSAVRRAEQVFAALKVDVRDRFMNDPGVLVDFLNDSANDEEAVRLGLKDASVLPAKPAIVPAPVAPVVPPAQV